jgi:spore coat protein U-like protein
MTGGASTLDYALYQETGRTTNWGNTPGTDTPAATIAPVLATTLTVYGRVASGQNVAAGAYTDTVTATVTY